RIELDALDAVRWVTGVFPIISSDFKSMIPIFCNRRFNFLAGAEPFCALVRAHLYLHWQVADPIAGHLELGKKALDAAARLQPDSGDLHWTRGLYYYYGSRDYASALAEYALAKRSLPNDYNIRFSIATVERRQDNWEESTRLIEEALQLDPRNIQFISELAGSNYYVLRRYAE